MKAQPVTTSALLHGQAVDHFRSGRMSEGIALLKQALELNPGSGEMHSHLGIALYQTGDEKQAERHFEKAARLSPKNPEVQTDCGTFLLESNRPKEAERLFRKALELKPDYAEALLNLGSSLNQQGNTTEVERLYRAAVRANPRWPEALYKLGMLYLRMDAPERHEQGRQYLEKALALNPKHEYAWAGLIRSYEKDGDHDREEKTLARAEKYVPQSSDIAILRVEVLLRQGKKDEVPGILAQISQKLKDPASAHPLVLRDLGKAYDETGDPAQAMRWFMAASESQKKTYDARQIDRGAFPREIEGYRTALASSGNWRPAPPLPADMPRPVFLVGFPRSGTTLLDQIFSGHPDIEVAEEKPAIRAAENNIQASGKKPAWELLDKIDDAGIEAARAAYFSAMRDAGCALNPGGVFIDKFPLNLVSSALIRRLFPEARFILALRHPCDCVLSNYMQRFMPNEAMIHMIDLNDAAKLYDRCFSAWEEARSVLDLNVHTIKYEDVVSDLKAEIMKALGFLGLDWQDSVAAFDETARKRTIKTPSRKQVTQKLYTKARGRWHKYREYMGDVPEILRPWAEKYGYSIDD